MVKNKVLFVITKGNFGGAQRYIYDLTVNAPKDFEIVVACGDQDGTTLKDKLLEKSIRTIMIEGLEREVSFFDEFRVCRNLINLIITERPSIIHLNSSKIGGIGAVAGRIASIITRGYSPKIIFTSHGWGFNEMHRSLFSRIFYMISHWITLILVHKTVAVSERTKKDVAHMPFVYRKIIVIHNGVGKFKLKTKKEARSILVGENNNKKIVIFSLSELHKNKGLDIALNGLSRLQKGLRDKIVYCIAGEGEEKEALEKLAEGLGIKEMIKFLGFVPNAKELLSGADMFLFPSRTENLPYGILEAGFAGVPVIAASVGGIPEIISDMQDGILVHPRNQREIAEAITYLTENPEKCKMFKEKIKEKISANFSLEKMIFETYLLYRSLLPRTSTNSSAADSL